MRQAGLFGWSEHLKRLSAHGDALKEFGRIIDFEAFRPILVAALAYGDGVKGGRPPYDPVAERCTGQDPRASCRVGTAPGCLSGHRLERSTTE